MSEHKDWPEFFDLIVKALRSFPEATRAVCEASCDTEDGWVGNSIDGLECSRCGMWADCTARRLREAVTAYLAALTGDTGPKVEPEPETP